MKIGGCDYPDGLLYDADRGTWAREEGGLFRLGVAPQLSWISGGFTAVTFRAEGSEVARGMSVGSVEGPRHFDVVRAPFDCAVVAANARLREEPRLINRDPYGEGWFALLRKLRGPSNLKPLDQVSDLLRGRLAELRVRCFSEFPDREMFEIGVECSAILVKLNELLAASPAGTVVHLVTDDPTSGIEMKRWQAETGNRLADSVREGSLYHFVVRKK